jgi:hypothetical protein
MNPYKLLFFVGAMLLGTAFGQGPVGTMEQDAANRIGDMLCPFVNILTGTLGRLAIILLLAVAVVMYFTVDARSAKGLAIAAAIGAILLFNFGPIQQIFTGLRLDTTTPRTVDQPRIDSNTNTVYCRALPTARRAPQPQQ